MTTNSTVTSMISNCYSLYSQEVQNSNEIPLIKDAPPTTRTIINQTLHVITQLTTSYEHSVDAVPTFIRAHIPGRKRFATHYSYGPSDGKV